MFNLTKLSSTSTALSSCNMPKMWLFKDTKPSITWFIKLSTSVSHLIAGDEEKGVIKDWNKYSKRAALSF